MNEFEKIKNQIIEFEKQTGLNELNPECAETLGSQLIAKVVKLWEEIFKEANIGLKKYDIGLGIADVYIYLQKICIALDIDLAEMIDDKMLINRARVLSDENHNKKIHPTPKTGRYYKIHNMYQHLSKDVDNELAYGQILGITDENGLHQKVYVIDENPNKPKFLKEIMGIIYPREGGEQFWIGSDKRLSVEEIAQKLEVLDYRFDIEVIEGSKYE